MITDIHRWEQDGKFGLSYTSLDDSGDSIGCGATECMSRFDTALERAQFETTLRWMEIAQQNARKLEYLKAAVRKAIKSRSVRRLLREALEWQERA